MPLWIWIFIPKILKIWGSLFCTQYPQRLWVIPFVCQSKSFFHIANIQINGINRCINSCWYQSKGFLDVITDSSVISTELGFWYKRWIKQKSEVRQGDGWRAIPAGHLARTSNNMCTSGSFFLKIILSFRACGKSFRWNDQKDEAETQDSLKLIPTQH